MKKTSLVLADKRGFFVADRVGFEPTSLLRDYLISSQGRYDHFDTCPSVCCAIIPNAEQKIKSGFAELFIYNLQIYLYNNIDKSFRGGIINAEIKEGGLP